LDGHLLILKAQFFIQINGNDLKRRKISSLVRDMFPNVDFKASDNGSDHSAGKQPVTTQPWESGQGAV